MIGNYGMGQDVQTIFDESMDMGRGFGDTFSDRTKQRIDEEALDLVKEAFDEAVVMLNNHRDHLDSLINQLLGKTTLSSNDFCNVLY